MQTAVYYRQRAAHVRMLSRQMTARDVVETMKQVAQDYDDIATDLDRGAIEVTHPSRLPQQHHPRGHG